MNKKCNKCGIEKEITEYYKNSSCNGGRMHCCKTCMAIYHKKRQQRDDIKERVKIRRQEKLMDSFFIEKNRNMYREYRKNNKEKMLLLAARRRSKQKGLIFNIEEKDIMIPDMCPVLGIPLIIGINKTCDGSPSIDRMNNNQGYIKENIKVISWRANSLKGNATIEELEKVRDYMYNSMMEVGDVECT